MRDKLWRMAYDRYHTQETDPEKRKENEERYHALVKMLAAVERQNLLQDIEEKKLLNCDADFESFIDGLEGAMMLLAEMAKYPEIKQIIEENALKLMKYVKSLVRTVLSILLLKSACMLTKSCSKSLLPVKPSLNCRLR